MSTPLQPSRRSFLAASVATTALAALTGCSTSSSVQNGPVPLRFTWWGNDYLNAQTNKVIDTFQAQHSNVTVKPEPGVWGSYWDKLATVTAANDAPDVINMDQKYIAEYGRRGALLDLSKLKGMDTSKLDSEGLKSGTYNGKLYGLSTGQNAYVIMANADIFKKVGVPLPDDKTWTWQDYIDIASKITTNSNGSIYGSSYGMNEADVIIWLRQHGENLYTDDGKLGYQQATLAGFWSRLKQQLDSKASPSASAAAEDAGASLDQSMFGTGKMAMSWWWTNQLSSLAGTTKSDIRILRAPSGSGKADQNGMYYKPSMFWSVSARTKHPDEAATFVDFLVNSQDAGAILLTDRGVPINSQIRSGLTSKLKPSDVTAMKFLDDVKPDVASAPPIPPVGASNVQNVVQRYTQDVLFGRRNPDDAAGAFTEEVQNMLNSAKK